jgi:hypothetical protein
MGRLKSPWLYIRRSWHQTSHMIPTLTITRRPLCLIHRHNELHTSIAPLHHERSGHAAGRPSCTASTPMPHRLQPGHRIEREEEMKHGRLHGSPRHLCRRKENERERMGRKEGARICAHERAGTDRDKRLHVRMNRAQDVT